MPGKNIKLDGQLYMTPEGDVYMMYGGWHRTDVGNIKGTKMYDKIISTHHTKEGAHVRRVAAKVIMNNLSYSVQ